MEREQRSEEMKVKDPRTEEESVHANDLLNLVLVSTHTHTHNIMPNRYIPTCLYFNRQKVLS